MSEQHATAAERSDMFAAIDCVGADTVSAKMLDEGECPRFNAEIWARRINDKWRSGGAAFVRTVIETGLLIQQAKEDLKVRFQRELVKQKLIPFSPRAAEMFMAIARHPVLSDANYSSHLPPHWPTLHELSRVRDAEQMLALIASGKIHPDMTRKALSASLPRRARQRKNERQGTRTELRPTCGPKLAKRRRGVSTTGRSLRPNQYLTATRSRVASAG